MFFSLPRDSTDSSGLADPLNLEAVDQVRQVAKCDVETVLAEEDKIKALISRAYSLTYGQGEQPVIEPAGGYRSGEGRPARLYRYRDDAVAEARGDGFVIAFTQDPNVRAYLDGLNVIFMNAIFRGSAHARPVR